MPHLKELHARYKDQGLVLIGVHSTNGGEKMADFVKEQGISYAICLDEDNKTKTAFRVDSFPDYYLIDRQGRLRVADLANGDLDRAVQVLLAETPKSDAKDVKKTRSDALSSMDAETLLGDSLAKAKESKRHILVHISGPG